VVSEDGDAGAGHIAHGIVHVGELPVAAGQAQHDLVEEPVWNVFDADQSHAETAGLFNQPRQVVVFPPLLPRELRGVHKDVGHSALARELEVLVRELVDLADGLAHTEGVDVDHVCVLAFPLCPRP